MAKRENENEAMTNQKMSAEDYAIDMQKAELVSDIEILVEYLKMKTRRKDWHAVSDAAVDIRELDAVLKTL
jgi:hypothetical protein